MVVSGGVTSLHFATIFRRRAHANVIRGHPLEDMAACEQVIQATWWDNEKMWRHVLSEVKRWLPYGPLHFVTPTYLVISCHSIDACSSSNTFEPFGSCLVLTSRLWPNFQLPTSIWSSACSMCRLLNRKVNWEDIVRPLQKIGTTAVVCVSVKICGCAPKTTAKEWNYDQQPRQLRPIWVF